MTTYVSSKHEMVGLRDFQRDTARYVFSRMFGDGADSTSRFLVADEVGLGKTLVARGVIAQIIEHLQAAGDRRVDIVYVASNTAIAAQNLRKLAPTGVEVDHHTDRLSLLPFNLDNLGKRDVNLVALTPRTSMDLRSSGGTFDERAAALAALRTIWGGRRVRGKGIAAIFAGGIGARGQLTKEQRVRARAAEFGSLGTRPTRLFRQALADVDRKRRKDGKVSLDQELHNLAHELSGKGVSVDAKQRKAAFIRQVREAMSWTGVQLLQPDLVILDEFQSFRDLLAESSDDWTGEIARTMFNYEHRAFNRSARVLLLSATPYVMHTTSAEAAAGSDLHYEDFLDTYRFLASGLPHVDAEVEQLELKRRLGLLRTTILDANITGAEPVRTAAGEVSQQLTRVMVRTERLASTADHNGMLRTVKDPVGTPSVTALEQYMDAAKVADYLVATKKVRSGDMLEYWKSAPYTLSFLGGHEYMLSKGLLEQAGANVHDAELRELLDKSKAVLNWRDIRAYRAFDPANGRLEQLYTDMFDRGAHRLLWMPPSCPYYEHNGRFDKPEARALTKRLIFSSWALVPTVVSTLTSFEAERRLHDEARSAGAATTQYDTDASSRHTRHLQLRQGLQSMSALVHRIPSPALATLADPNTLAEQLRASGKPATWDLVRRAARDAIGVALTDVLPSRRGSSAGSAAWYVLAPMLLDAKRESENGYSPRQFREDWFGARDEVTALTRYLDQLKNWLAEIDDTGSTDAGVTGWAARLGVGIPEIPEDLEDVLALSALSGPPSCLYRALSRFSAGIPTVDRVRQSAAASEAFVSLLNSWEATRIINAHPAPGDYWLKALEYCAEGHLQSVLDEYIYVLTEWRGYDRQADKSLALSRTVTDLQSVLTLRTAVYQVLRTDQAEPSRETLRGRFAVRFGDSDSEDRQLQRVDAVSLAFNSPFWPFVLTSTSVGQEGLDFHLYCHAVSHWNLPRNPVDLEQREGRVHRYKGHAVRKNVGLAEGPPSADTEPWAWLFSRACERHDGASGSDIVPYWIYLPEHVPPDQLSRIERHLPITPYSREASRIESLLSSVAYYRLAFGQPRQEELVEHVLRNVADPELRAELAQIRVNLAPPRPEIEV